jgi:hypothetical protein
MAENTEVVDTNAAPSGEVAEVDWKAEARKWESRAKENLATARQNESAAQRLAEIEEASKSELEKALARAEQAEQKAQQFESEKQISKWKVDVSKDTGVPAEALVGSTLEDIQAHAEILKPLIQDANRGPVVVTAGDAPTNTALNGDGITDSLKRVLGIP